MRIYKEEILARCSRWCAAHDYNEALALPSEPTIGNGVAIFTRDGDAARDFAARSIGGWSASKRADPVSDRLLHFRGWKKSASADLNSTGGFDPLLYQRPRR